MKISYSVSKNLSITEHFEKIEKKFKDHTIDILISKDHKILNMKCKERFFFKIINKKDFDKYLFILEKEHSIVLNANIYKSLYEEHFLNEKQVILKIEKDNISNPFIDESIDITRFILKNNESSFMLDTSIFGFFYINKKTSNHFSKIILASGKVIYLLKRGGFYSIFIVLI